MTNSSLRFNVDNVFNKHYFSSLSNYTCWTPMAGATMSGCTSLPYAYAGSPRTFSTALTIRY